jgi:glucose/arabinose dehydrogenase
MTEVEKIRRGLYRGQALDLVVSHFVPGSALGGTISIVRDENGDGFHESRDDIVTGLPSDGENGNQQPAIGPDGRIYFGQGARTNAGVPGPGPADEPRNGAILRVRADGTGLEVFARGLRNSFDLAFTPDGELFATENGPDPSGPMPVAGAPDELNAILPGGDYGWPSHFGFPPEGSGTLGPVATFGGSTSSDGIALSTSPTSCGTEGDLFVAQFGSFIDPSIGRRVVRVDLVGRRGVLVEPFASDFGRPLDVAVGPAGDLYVADFSNVFFVPGTAAVWRIRPVDSDADGTPDACE